MNMKLTKLIAISGMTPGHIVNIYKQTTFVGNDDIQIVAPCYKVISIDGYIVEIQSQDYKMILKFNIDDIIKVSNRRFHDGELKTYYTVVVSKYKHFTSTGTELI